MQISKSIRRERDNFVVVEIDCVARMGDDGADVAREEMLALSDAEHERTPTAGADKHAGNIRMYDRDAIGADDLSQRFPHGLDQRGLRFFVRPSKVAPMRWASTSVSVWDWKTWPFSSSWARSDK